MREEYEQLELDTRRQLDKAIAQLTEDTVKTAGEMITACGEAPTAVRNRHEAFGIAAERLAKIKKAVKAIDQGHRRGHVHPAGDAPRRQLPSH